MAEGAPDGVANGGAPPPAAGAAAAAAPAPPGLTTDYAARVSALLAVCAVPALDARVGLWSVLRKNDALEAVSSGPARLYFTPNDVNLSIETKDADVCGEK